MTDLVNRFAHVVRRLRVERGWSQEELAARADLNRSYLGEVERGHAVPSLLTLDKLALALDVNLSAMIVHCEQRQVFAESQKIADSHVQQHL